MEIFARHFSELTAGELYDILALRSAVFVVEQNCVYQDLDGVDKVAFHVWIRDGRGLTAALRVYRQGEIHLGRVVTRFRREGLGTALVREGIRLAREKYGEGDILVSAQCQARPFYESLGFEARADTYLEDGIPHIEMRLRAGKNGL